MAGRPTAVELLDALAAAVVAADADDASTLREVGRALDAARAGGALTGALATEAEQLGAELASSQPGEALARLGELLDGPERPSPAAPKARARLRKERRPRSSAIQSVERVRESSSSRTAAPIW